jgi:glutathione S-transferase
VSLVLYGNRESGHSYKVRLLLTLAGISHEYVHIDLEVPRSGRPAAFRAASRFGEVPVLVRDDGSALVQSNAILLHLARDRGRFGPPRGATWDDLTSWLFWEANRVGFSVPNLRAARFRGDTPADVMAWLEARVIDDLGVLDGQVGARPFLLGDAPCVVDVACCAYLFWPEQAGIDLSRWPAVAAWLERIAALPGYKPPYALMSPPAGP